MYVIYDVLLEPWIPVIDQNGARRQLGILETLAQAQNLREISDPSPLVAYGLYRLLCVFLMDALRPEELYDIEDLLEAGSFPMDKIADYVSLCKAEGTSFNLFDEKRPFLQTPYVAQWDGEKCPVGYLDYTVPTGNNHVHFNHLVSGKKIPSEEAARKLLPCYLFATAGVQGYPSSVNAAPPFFTIIKGENLFETLVNGLIPTEEIPIAFDLPPVFWRNEAPVEPKKKVSTTSWLYGMLFPARRISLVPDFEGKTVSAVYFSQGENFCSPENWTDPHVTYRVNKEGRFPWRPNRARAAWRNLSDLIDVRGKHAPQCVQVYQELHDKKPVDANICLYGVETSNASYLSIAHYTMRVPTEVMKNPLCVDLIRESISNAEEIAWRLKKALTHRDIPPAAQEQCVQRFYHDCEEKLFRMCSNELSAENVDSTACQRDWVNTIIRYCRQELEETINGLTLRASALMELYQQQRQLQWYLKTKQTEVVS